MYYSIIVIKFISNELIIKSKNYKLHTHIYYNYSIEVMRKKKKNLGEKL